MRDTVMPAIKLLAITLMAALLLSGVNYITKGPIAQHTLDKQNAARRSALSEATDFEEINMETLAGADKYADIKAVHKGTNSGAFEGYTIIAVSKGYGGNIEITVGIKPDGKIDTVLVNSHSETKDIGTKCMDAQWLAQYSGKGGQVSLGTEINAVSGATMTSAGITNAVNSALMFYENILAGGDAQ